MGKDILITPASALINFSGANTSTVNLEVKDNGDVSFVGVSSGKEQFTIYDSISGSVMTVNSIDGDPIFDVNFDSTITAGRPGKNDFVLTGTTGYIGIGTNEPLEQLHVTGNTRVDGIIYVDSIGDTDGNIGITFSGSGNVVIDNDIILNNNQILDGEGNSCIQFDGGGNTNISNDIDVQGQILSGGTNISTLWASGGGGTTPGGSDTQIQWNNNGAFSGSSNFTWDEADPTLTINGDVTIDTSGNTNDPIFKILGSAGELFTVTDSLTGELFSVNDISGLPILQVMSDDTVLIGDVSAPSLNTTSVKNVNIGSTILYDIISSGYTSAYFDYNVLGNGSARAGNVMAIWSGSTVNYTETNTNDIGDTSPVTVSVDFSGSNISFIADASTNNWVVKTIVRSI